MPLVNLICLANSEKWQGRCVAGLRLDGQGWVRPVAPDTEHGQLLLRHMKLEGGTEPRVFDVIAVDLKEPRPEPGQPENWLIGRGPWLLRDRPAPPEVLAGLHPAVAAGPDLLGSNGSRIENRRAEQLPSSLALVRPSRLRFWLAKDLRDFPQARVEFKLDDQRYDLPLTDPAWKGRILRKLAGQGQCSPEEAGIPANASVFLTVSLGELFHGYHYKLVAAIAVLPEGQVTSASRIRSDRATSARP
jgi:hypothetical protein